MDNKRVKSLSYLFVLGYLIGGVLAIILSLTYNYNREHIGIAFIIGSLLSFIGIRSYHGRKKGEEETRGIYMKIAVILWLLCILISIILFLDYSMNYYLPLSYFIVISIAIAVISMQILMRNSISKFYVSLILVEIIATSILVSSCFLFLFPSPAGNDAPFHIDYINHIIETGSIGGEHGQYTNFPVFHILFATFRIVPQLDIMSSFLIGGVIQAVSVLFLFAIMRKILDLRIALFSSLIVSFSSQLILPRYSFYLTAFVVIFFILLFYLLLRTKPKEASISVAFLIILSFIIMTLTHPLAPAIAISLLSIILITSRFIHSDKTIITVRMLLFMIFLMIFLWSRPLQGSIDLFSNLFQSLRTAFGTVDVNYTDVEQVTLSPLYNWVDVALYEMGFTIAITLAIAGSFILIRRMMSNTDDNSIRYPNLTVTLAFVTLTFIPLPYVLAILYPQSAPDRWFPFITLLIGVFSGAFIVFLARRAHRLRMKFLISLLLSLMLFFMITSPIANPNSHIYSTDMATRTSLTESEMKATEFLKEIDASNIHGNSKYILFMGLGLDSKNFVDPNKASTYDNGILIVRDFDLEKGFTIPLFGSHGVLLENILPSSQFLSLLDNSTKILDSKEVYIYYND